ncbi:hypothetical protein [Paenibacillus silviterrae]|uniref:hypothetical protein n=1 Tax=Paenibacillus silviterrae TaxID=3242194 RepID=UPI0025428302|nr:hypothetical protein [Paenibacillus chinjuensis]
MPKKIIQEIPTQTTLYEKATYDSMEEASYASKAYARLLPKAMKKLPDFEGALDIGTEKWFFFGGAFGGRILNVMECVCTVHPLGGNDTFGPRDALHTP